MPQPNNPILIVGAGPTGLTLAVELARRKVPFRILEKRVHPSSHSKAVSISASTLQVFEQMGLLSDFLRVGRKVHDIYIHHNGQRRVHIDYRHLQKEGGIEHPFILTLRQPESEQILAKHLLGAQIERGSELIDFHQDHDSVTATIRSLSGHEERATFSYLVGCDGHHSQVRKKLAIEMWGDGYDDSFILADFRLQWEGDKNSVHYFMNNGRFSLIVPLPDEWYRVVIQVPSRNPESIYPDPSLHDFQKFADEHWPSPVRFTEARSLSAARLYHEVAREFSRGRVFLAGDACHQFSPVGGQGMNTGVQDAFNLAWKLAYVLKGHSSEKLLETYAEERRPLAEQLVQSCDGSMQMLLNRPDLAPTLRELQKKLVASFANRKYLRQEFPFQFSGIAQSYAKGEGLAAQRKPAAGMRAPNMDLKNTQDYSLLYFGEPLEPPTSPRDWITTHVVHSPEIAKVYQAQPGNWVLIRPDRYIACRGHATPYAAFFDVDETLVSISCMPSFLKFYIQEKSKDSPQWAQRLKQFMQEFSQLSDDSRQTKNRKYYEAFTDVPVQQVHDLARKWFHAMTAQLGPRFYIASSVTALKEHQNAGAEVVLVSGSFDPLLKPIAEDLGVKQWLAAPLEIKGSIYTGRLLDKPTIGDGKATAIRRFLRTQKPHLELQNCYAYGDHESDRPMLNLVGHPVWVR